LGDSVAAANGQGSGFGNVPGPVGADERASILGMFADGSDYGSAAFRPDISATTADQLLSDLGMGDQPVYGGGAQYANAQVLRTGVMTDAGAAGADNGGFDYERSYSRGGEFVVEASKSPFDSQGTDGFSGTEIESMREDNLARAQRLATQAAAESASPWSARTSWDANTGVVRADIGFNLSNNGAMPGAFAGDRSNAAEQAAQADDYANEARRLSNYATSPMSRWIDMSNQPAGAYTAEQWKSEASNFKKYMGTGFSRDSVYNGLWTKGAQLDIEAGNNNRGIWDQVAGVGIEANTPAAHADVGSALVRGIGKRIGDGLGNAMGMAGRSRKVTTPVIGSNLESTQSLTAEYKEGLNTKEFDRKVNRIKNAINNGELTSNIPHGVSDAARRAETRAYRKAVVERIERMYENNPEAKANALNRLATTDMDHIRDLQLSGKNVRRNFKSLDSDVNQELGRQFSRQIPRNAKIPITNLEVKNR